MQGRVLTTGVLVVVAAVDEPVPECDPPPSNIIEFVVVVELEVEFPVAEAIIDPFVGDG